MKDLNARKNTGECQVEIKGNLYARKLILNGCGSDQTRGWKSDEAESFRGLRECVDQELKFRQMIRVEKARWQKVDAENLLIK